MDAGSWANSETGVGGRIGSCHEGIAQEAMGRANSPPIAIHQIACRRAAEDRRQNHAAKVASNSSTVPLAAVSTRSDANESLSVSASMLFPLGFGLPD